MPTLTDAKWDALRAQGFTGSISDMTLQWLAAFSPRIDPVNLYTNPELAGGAASTPGDSNPPTDHTFAFINGNAAPEDLGDGFFGWEFNPEAVSTRVCLQYDLTQAITAPVNGQQYEISCFAENLGSNGYQANISILGNVGMTVVVNDRALPPGERRRSRYVIEITDAASFAANLRIGTGTTSNNAAHLRMSRPEVINLEVPVIEPPKTISDGWKTMLLEQTGLPPERYHRNDFWFALLGSLGFTGSMNDRELAFWLAGGDPSGGVPFLVTDNDVPLTTDGGVLLLAE